MTLADADYRVLAGFRAALRRFLRFSELAAAAGGLTPRQYQALLALRGSAPGRLTVGGLAGELEVRHHSAVGLIDRLLSKSLVKRRTGSEDRRQVLLSLTPKAEALLAKLSAAHRDELKRLAPLLQTLLKHFKAEK